MSSSQKAICSISDIRWSRFNKKREYAVEPRRCAPRANQISIRHSIRRLISRFGHLQNTIDSAIGHKSNLAFIHLSQLQSSRVRLNNTLAFTDARRSLAEYIFRTSAWRKLMQGQNNARSAFRPDINGLRAWAVTAVILYHFGIPGFNGGFIGVDVFFVISGFLMTGIVVKGLERGNFSTYGFYLARARRIVPALLCLCFVLLSLGYIFLLPLDYKTLGTHVISSVGFFSNFKFWDEAGYFDVASHEKWLLHTWSLSVEWQFYLILPLALWGVWRLRPGRTTQTIAISIGILLSLGLSIWTSNTSPTTAFFLLPTRAWEMLAGGMVFLTADRAPTSIRARRLIEAAGLVLIVISAMLFDVRSPWPGWRAIVPVGGTMMVLFVSVSSSLWTSNRPAQWLGDRSYSVYLWHWPVFVALAYVELQRDLVAIIAGILFTMVLGELSYRWIELPTRHWLGKRSAHAVTIQLALAAVLVLAPAVVIRTLSGLNGRFDPMVESAAAEINNINPRREECHAKQGFSSPSCVWGGRDWKVIALGDSHTSALVTSIAAAAENEEPGVVQWSYSGCSFLLGVNRLETPASGYQCREFVEWARTQLLDSVPERIPVVIVNRYAAYAFGPNDDPRRNNVPLVYFSKIHDRTTPEFLEEFAKHIADTACEVAKRHTVFLMRPIPEMGFDVPRVLSRRLAFGIKQDLSISIEDYQRRNQWVWAAQDAAQKRCGVQILDPTPALCHDGRCFGSENLRPLYSDDDHLSEFGNKRLVPMFHSVFADLHR